MCHASCVMRRVPCVKCYNAATTNSSSSSGITDVALAMACACKKERIEAVKHERCCGSSGGPSKRLRFLSPGAFAARLPKTCTDMHNNKPATTGCRLSVVLTHTQACLAVEFPSYSIPRTMVEAHCIRDKGMNANHWSIGSDWI